MSTFTHTLSHAFRMMAKRMAKRVFPFSQVGWLGARRAQGLEQGVLPFPGAASGGCATDSELAQRWGRTQCSARSKHGTILGEKS